MLGQGPSYVNIVGAASATATNVNVNNTLAYRKGEYYRVELPTNNGSAAVWLGVTNRVVQNGTTNTVTGNVFVAKSPEIFSHDADGNLTNDGHWAYVWDAENRLTRMVAPTAIPTGARYALNFTNDWRGRRTSKVVSNWTGSAWSKSYEQKFVYDGWNLIATLDAANTLLYSFQWGTDLSGTMQGAGGVGGLVSMTVHSGASAGTYFYAFDGNGNVVALINATDGTIAARYEYGPFGELIRATGPLAFLNPFRFSTKFQDDETGFLYYGYRYYDPGAGRWLSRDPIGERGGINLSGFVGNNSLTRIDFLGLQFPGGVPIQIQWPPNATVRSWPLSEPTPLPIIPDNPVYDLDPPTFFDRMAEPSGTVFTPDIAGVIEDLKRRTQNGRCCTKRITITAHNGVPGTLPLGNTGQISADSLKKQEEVNSNPDKQKLREIVNKEDNALLGLKPFLCKSGVIDFVTCKSGAGPQGQKLQTHLNQLFGPNIKVILHQYDCRWSYGTYKEVK